MRIIPLLFTLILAGFLLKSESAFAGYGATLLFREGHVAYLANGYSALVEEYKKLDLKEAKYKIIELIWISHALVRKSSGNKVKPGFSKPGTTLTSLKLSF